MLQGQWTSKQICLLLLVVAPSESINQLKMEIYFIQAKTITKNLCLDACMESAHTTGAS